MWLAPLVFLRPVGLRTAEWAELEIETRRWNMPAAKMKLRQPHVVPLSRQALAILDELRPVTGEGSYLFPGLRTAARPMSENTVNAALRRLGFDRDTMTGHGFRATARTILDEVLGIRPDFIRSEEHTSELQSLMRNSYAVFCLKTKTLKVKKYTDRLP